MGGVDGRFRTRNLRGRFSIPFPLITVRSSEEHRLPRLDATGPLPLHRLSFFPLCVPDEERLRAERENRFYSRAAADAARPPPATEIYRPRDTAGIITSGRYARR